MRKTILAALASAGLLVSAAAVAQGLDLDISTVDPLTKLPAEKWVQLVVRVVNPSPIVGKDSVYMVNATGEDLTSVTCRKYTLVGSNPYVTGEATTNAPAILPKWSVTLVPTKGFDTYCKSGVEATGAVATYHGNLNSADKSFTSATFVVFQKAQ